MILITPAAKGAYCEVIALIKVLIEIFSQSSTILALLFLFLAIRFGLQAVKEVKSKDKDIQS